MYLMPHRGAASPGPRVSVYLFGRFDGRREEIGDCSEGMEIEFLQLLPKCARMCAWLTHEVKP
jgi:hypothetical protein